MTTTPTQGLRHYSRVPFSVPGTLQLRDRTIPVRLVDISLKGALVEMNAKRPFVLKDKCRLVLPLTHGAESIVMVGVIAHVVDLHVGVACKDIDVTSLTQLRRVMELNLGDPELMNRELLHMLESR